MNEEYMCEEYIGCTVRREVGAIDGACRYVTSVPANSDESVAAVSKKMKATWWHCLNSMDGRKTRWCWKGELVRRMLGKEK